MWPTKAGLLIAISVWSASAQAQCLASIGELKAALESATTKQNAVTRAADAADAKAAKLSDAVDTAIANLASARRATNTKEAERAKLALNAAQLAYLKAAEAQPGFIVPRLEAERVVRGARQALNEAITSYQQQAEALQSAVARARRGEVTPSLTDALSCDGADCARITPRTHAAMITIGAVADTVTTDTWPAPGRECDFVLIDPAFGRNHVLRNLLGAQKNASAAAQAATQSLRNSQQKHEAALSARNTAIITDADLEPVRAAVPATAADLKKSKDAAAAAKEQDRVASANLARHLDYWDNLAAAVMAATRAATEAVQPRQGNLEAAALAVMGAHPTGKAKACLLKVGSGQEQSVTFAPVPAAECQ